MRKFSKIFLVGFLAFAIVLPNFMATLTVFANGSNYATVGAEIIIEDMPDSGELGQVLHIPKGTSPDGNVDIIIHNPRGAKIYNSDEDDITEIPNLTDEGATYGLLPDIPGRHKIVYAVYTADKEIMASTVSRPFYIDVTGEKFDITFEENSEIVVPSITNFDYEITLPFPIVYDINGEEIDFSVMAPNLTIEGTLPDGNTPITFSTDAEGNYTFQPEEVDGAGAYTVTYIYEDANITSYYVKEILVDPSFDSDNIDFNYTLEGSMPSSLVLGNEATLPKPIARDAEEGNRLLEIYTNITIEYIVDEGDNIPYTVDGFSFTPMDEGDYKVLYEIIGPYDDNVYGEFEYLIENVEDTQAPEISIVEEYDENEIDNTEYDFVDAKHQIPSVIATNETVDFPAIHATDNFYASSEIEYRREVRKSGINGTLLKIEGTEDPEEFYQKDGDPHEQFSVNFYEEGTYVVVYIATDDEGDGLRTREYFNIEVQDGFTDTVAPRITMPTIQSFANTGEEITFNKPTVIDYESLGSTKVIDKRPLVELFYYEGDDDTNLFDIDLTEDSYYEFEVPSTIEEYIHILVRATDYHGNIETKTHKINILDIVDTEAPYFFGAEPTIDPVDQNEAVNIPEITIVDNNASLSSKRVDVLDPNGNKVQVKNLQYNFVEDVDGTNDGFEFSGEYTTTVAGEYEIVFTFTDPGNNVFIKRYMQYVNNTTKPQIILPTISNELELGESIFLPIPEISDNGETIDNQASPIIEFTETSGGYDFNSLTFKFTPFDEGTFSFRYNAEDEFGNTNQSTIYTIVVKDTIAPLITIDEAGVIKPPFKGAQPVDENIIIPGYTVFDDNGVKEHSVRVEDPNNNKVWEKFDKSKDSYTLEADSSNKLSDGTYTVTYRAIDFYGNEETVTKTISVGDTLPPTITINNIDLNKPEIIQVGDKLQLDFASISLSDNKTTYDSDVTDETLFSVMLTLPEGETVDLIQKDGEYEIDLAGEYKITYRLVDNAGNERVVEHLLQGVQDEIPASIIATQTLVIVLIIISLIVLAGVVVYFIRSREFLSLNIDDDKK